jgi:hypothetical protein
LVEDSRTWEECDEYDEFNVFDVERDSVFDEKNVKKLFNRT